MAPVRQVRVRPTSRWSEYHAASRFYAGYHKVKMDQSVLESLKNECLEYRFAERLPLDEEPAATLAEVQASVFEVMARRKSTRSFSGNAVSKWILDAAVRGSFIQTSTANDAFARRPTPSAGALYPIELYLVSFVGDDFPRERILHLSAHPRQPDKHWALLPRPADQEMVNAALLEQLPEGSAGVVILTALVSKSAVKYAERAYRFCLIEAGHIAQNLTLALETFGVGSLCIGGFADSVLNGLVGTDGFDEAAVYTICFGYPED